MRSEVRFELDTREKKTSEKALGEGLIYIEQAQLRDRT